MTGGTAGADDAVVYDLDGTLVHLSVDWDVVRNEAAALLNDRGIATGDADLWQMLDTADEHGHRNALETVISDHERTGARESVRLSRVDELVAHPPDLPIGVCSLNCESACRIALDRHGIADRVDAVVGRDTVPTRKPAPEPLLATLDRLGIRPDRAVFIGDSRRDELTAERAGVRFEYVDD